MDFKTSQKLYSVPRMRKYLNACAGNKRDTMQLYRYNLRLCQRFYGALNLFEVMLRNAINDHYAAYYSDPDWIVNQADAGKLLEYNKDEIRQTEAGYRRRGIYNNDKMVASLTMGFWTKLFSKKRFRGHHMKAKGFGNPKVDKAIQGIKGRPAIRGREQQLMDFHGGVGSRRVANRIRGVSRYNPAGRVYHHASNLLFGNIAPYTGVFLYNEYEKNE